jgi:hypothetical protein
MQTAAVGVLILLTGMGAGWLARGLLLRTLRDRHPEVFAELGHPSARNLASVLPRHGDLQVKFWRYLWNGKVFLIQDRTASMLALIALFADAGLAIGTALLLWSAAA